MVRGVAPIASSVVLMALVPAATTRESSEGQVCESSQSRVTNRLTGETSTAIARFPRLAVAPSGVFVIGVSFQLVDQTSLREPPLHVWNPAGRDIGRPSGRFTFLYPRGFVDANNRLHVIWGEPGPATPITTSQQWVFGRSRSVWTSVYDAASGWSKATEVPLATSGVDGLRWDSRGTGDNLGRGGSAGIGVEELRRAKGAPLQYLMFQDNGTATVVPIPAPREAKSVDISIDGNRWVAAYRFADPAKPTPPDGLSIFVIASEDSGHTWTTPIIVKGTAGATDLLLLTGRNRRVHLVWRQSTTEGLRIRHASTLDAGKTWDRSVDLDPGARAENLRGAVDGCGSIHLTFEDWGHEPDGIHVVHAVFDGRWLPLEHVLPKRRTMTADLATLPSGDVGFVYVARSGEDPSDRFATYYTVLSARR